MRTKLLNVAMSVFIVMISACVNSGDKWSEDAAKNSDDKESGWQQNQQSSSDQKKASSSYWNEESRY